MTDQLAKVPVVMAFTPDFLLPAATCIQSILRNSRDTDVFHFFFLMSRPLPKEHRDLLNLLLAVRGVITYVDLENKIEPKDIDSRFTIASLFRLILPDLISGYDTVLYVDCDMIIRNNLAELYWHTDVSGYFMAGVFEATLPDQERHVINMGSIPGRYINSGLLIMNLPLLRKNAMSEKFIIGLDNDKLIFPDQDVINHYCFGKILGLAPYWNGIRTFYLEKYRDVFLKYYSNDDWLKVQEHGNVHYTGPKPWNQFTIHFDTWWKEYERLPVLIKESLQINFGLRMFGIFYKTQIGKGMIDGGRRVKQYIVNQ